MINQTFSKRRCNSDEETTSLTSVSSSSISEGRTNSDKRNSEKRNRRKKGAKRNSKNRQRKNKTTSKKQHDAPMQKRDIYFALDCEMVGVGPEGLYSALARLSIINWDNELVLDTYVKVDDEVTDYRTFVSGIRQEDITSDSAMTLEEVRTAATKILRGKILIGHGLENDLKVIGINHRWCDIRDTATYEPYMRRSPVINQLPVLRPRKLRDLAWEVLGSQIQLMGKAHSPIEDATATMELYKAERKNWELHIMKQVNACSNTVNCQAKPERKSDMRGLKKVTVKPGNGTLTHRKVTVPRSR